MSIISHDHPWGDLHLLPSSVVSIGEGEEHGVSANVWERWRERVDDRLGDPIWWNDVLQLAKTVLAAVAAWVLAASVLDLPQPFLAPWAALLVVHATVYRTFSKGMQQVAATVVAVLLATVVGEAFGLTTGAITG